MATDNDMLRGRLASATQERAIAHSQLQHEAAKHKELVSQLKEAIDIAHGLTAENTELKTKLAASLDENNSRLALEMITKAQLDALESEAADAADAAAKVRVVTDELEVTQQQLSKLKKLANATRQRLTESTAAAASAETRISQLAAANVEIEAQLRLSAAEMIDLRVRVQLIGHL